MKRGVLALLMLLTVPACAHEVRPAYLALREASAGEFEVVWKTPMRGDLRLALAPRFSGRTEAVTPVSERRTGGAAVQTWRMKTSDPLRGQTVAIVGLEGTMTDALVRIEFSGGDAWTGRLTPARPSTVIPARRGGPTVAGAYLGLGVEHILLGIDHLLFVLALLLVAHGTWRLVKTVTAFTLAHSITLAGATLGLVQMPGAPTEAAIALSIVFVAAEVVHARQGRLGIAAHAPWVVAFAFGLLHGFGFAGALAEVGLPDGQIPLALLFFNLGVEAGQLLFIGAVLGASALLGRLRVPCPGWVRRVPPYAIGSTATFWLMQRVAAF